MSGLAWLAGLAGLTWFDKIKLVCEGGGGGSSPVQLNVSSIDNALSDSTFVNPAFWGIFCSFIELYGLLFCMLYRKSKNTFLLWSKIWRWQNAGLVSWSANWLTSLVHYRQTKPAWLIPWCYQDSTVSQHYQFVPFSLPVSGHSLVKDVVVAFSVLVATVGCWVAVLQKRKAKEQMERMIKDMKILQQAEDGLQELQLRYTYLPTKGSSKLIYALWHLTNHSVCISLDIL